MVNPLANSKSLQLTSRIPALSVTVDERRLHQVLVNLLSNAVKFTIPGAGEGLGSG